MGYAYNGYKHNKTGNYIFIEGSEEIEGYTNLTTKGINPIQRVLGNTVLGTYSLLNSGNILYNGLNYSGGAYLTTPTGVRITSGRSAGAFADIHILSPSPVYGPNVVVLSRPGAIVHRIAPFTWRNDPSRAEYGLHVAGSIGLFKQGLMLDIGVLGSTPRNANMYFTVGTPWGEGFMADASLSAGILVGFTDSSRIDLRGKGYNYFAGRGPFSVGFATSDINPMKSAYRVYNIDASVGTQISTGYLQTWTFTWPFWYPFVGLLIP